MAKENKPAAENKPATENTSEDRLALLEKSFQSQQEQLKKLADENAVLKKRLNTEEAAKEPEKVVIPSDTFTVEVDEEQIEYKFLIPSIYDAEHGALKTADIIADQEKYSRVLAGLAEKRSGAIKEVNRKSAATDRKGGR